MGPWTSSSYWGSRVPCRLANPLFFLSATLSSWANICCQPDVQAEERYYQLICSLVSFEPGLIGPWISSSYWGCRVPCWLADPLFFLSAMFGGINNNRSGCNCIEKERKKCFERLFWLYLYPFFSCWNHSTSSWWVGDTAKTYWKSSPHSAGAYPPILITGIRNCEDQYICRPCW